MEIINMKISEIIPYENNPRINNKAVDKTAMSIKEYGWRQPIVVDKNFVVIAGHTRLKAAIKLGMETCPVFVSEDLTDAQVKGYRIADNKTGDLAIWDMDLLGDEIKELVDMGINVELTGFNADDFEVMDFSLTKNGGPLKKTNDSFKKSICPKCGFEFNE